MTKEKTYDFEVINTSNKDLPIGVTLKVVAKFMFGNNRYALKRVSKNTKKRRSQ